MLELLVSHPLMQASEGKALEQHGHDDSHDHAHEALHHSAQALFLPLPDPLKRQALRTQLDNWVHRHQPSLLRIKGLAQISNSSLVTVHWSSGDAQADMALCSTSADKAHDVQLGLTVIVKKDSDSAASPALLRALA